MGALSGGQRAKDVRREGVRGKARTDSKGAEVRGAEGSEREA
jgi:hypothetical protein